MTTKRHCDHCGAAEDTPTIRRLSGVGVWYKVEIDEQVYDFDSGQCLADWADQRSV